MARISIIALCVAAIPACAIETDSGDKQIVLEEEDPELWDLLQRTRQEGRRPTDAELVAIGSVRVGNKSAGQQPPMSQNSDMTVSTPFMVFRPQSNMYIGYGSWEWNIDANNGIYPWTDDSFLGEIGGKDAFGIHYSRPVIDIFSDTQSCPYNWGSTQGWGTCVITDATREKADEQNVVHTHQEQVGGFFFPPGINMALGDIFHIFRPIGTECLQAWTTYVHTYDDTEINGISLGPFSLGIQWAPAEGGWQKASFGSEEFCP